MKTRTVKQYCCEFCRKRENPTKHMEIILKEEEIGLALSELGERQRMFLLRKLIWTAPDMHDFYAKAVKELNSNKFKDSLD